MEGSDKNQTQGQGRKKEGEKSLISFEVANY